MSLCGSLTGAHPYLVELKIFGGISSIPFNFLQFGLFTVRELAPRGGARCGACSKIIFVVNNSVIPTRKRSGGFAHPLDVSVLLSVVPTRTRPN